MRPVTPPATGGSPWRRAGALAVLVAVTAIGLGGCGTSPGQAQRDQPASSWPAPSVRVRASSFASAPPSTNAPTAGPPLVCSPDEQTLPALVRDARTGILERQVPDPARTALLIGDSQTAGVKGVRTEQTWPVLALRSLGYRVCALAAGGMGFTRAAVTGAYADALAVHWLAPHGALPLVVVEGGGNDAAAGAPAGAVDAGASVLLDALHTRYPSGRIVVIGPLSGATQAEPRRSSRQAADRTLQRVVTARDTRFVSVRDLLDDGTVSLLDQVHPSAAGHAQLAPVVAARLRAAGVPALR